MRELSLSPLTVLPCSPLEQIDAALDAGYDSIGLRLLPVLPTDIDVMADAELQAQIESRLAGTTLGVLDIEVVRVAPDLDVSALAPLIEFSGRLGARWLAVTALLAADYRDDDEADVMKRMSELCTLTAHHGLGVMVEFMAFRGISSYEEAKRIVASVAHPNIAVTIDALHFFRSGGSVEALAEVERGRLSCVQLCDGPSVPPDDLPREARYGRKYPGDGELPLAALLAALPDDLPAAVEVPSSRKDLSITARAKEGASRARGLITRVEATAVDRSRGRSSELK